MRTYVYVTESVTMTKNNIQTKYILFKQNNKKYNYSKTVNSHDTTTVLVNFLKKSYKLQIKITFIYIEDE